MTASPPAPRTLAALLRQTRRRSALLIALELAVIVAVAAFYSSAALLDFDARRLQQTGEHSEAATLPILTEIGLVRYGVIPLWNPYMMTGFPYAGDLISNLYNPIATIPVLLWGGVNGMKVSVFLAFVVAGLGQWALGYVLGLRSPIRLWSALLVMLSGGLGLFWRVGWYQLLIGMAWFPCAYAAVIWALRSGRRVALAAGALAVAMVLTSSAAYYVFYLYGSLVPVVLVALAFARAGERLAVLKRAAVVFALSAALVAVVFLPVIDVYRLSSREAPPDPQQGASQSIVYALVNYVVAEGKWFNTDILGQAPGYAWFYIGYLPLAALVGLPLAFNGLRRRAFAVTVLAALTLLLLAWHANRHTFVGWIYEALPVLYVFRFPLRLLVLAAVPLVALGGFGLQGLSALAYRWTRRLEVHLTAGRGAAARDYRIPLAWLGPALFGLLMLQSVWDVYRVNQPVVFAPGQTLSTTAATGLGWLKQYDTGLYYVNAGDWRVFWSWTPAAYDLEQPLLDLQYNRYLNSRAAQIAAGALVQATPRYQFAWTDVPAPAGGVLLREFDGVPLYELPNALPFAFGVAPERLGTGVPLAGPDVEAFAARWANPNRLEVTASAGAPGQQLVALVSMFPGWRVLADGQPLALAPVNDYLGVQMLSGTHTYTFVYEPAAFTIGLAISVLALVLTLAWVFESPLRRAWAAARRVRARRRLPPAVAAPPRA